MQKPWFILTQHEIFHILDTNEKGLTSVEAKRRLRQYGPNTLPEAKLDTVFTIFLRQFQSPLIYVLLIASAVIFVLGESTDASIILFVLCFNAVVGAFQEGKAQNTLAALKNLSKTSTTVIRNGKESIISDELLVPGDIIILNEGQRVPADARILEEHNISVDEAALTGESVPVHKVVALEHATASTPVSDQKNIVFRGTYIATGKAKAIVVATGKNTELGKIAQSIETINTDMPLKRSVQHLTHQIMIIVGTISVLLFFLGILTGHEAREMFATVVSLAVSAIPEGLPIVLTLVLTTGVWRMSKRNALIKKLNAVEALGQTTVIAVDKTGTITQNELMVTTLYTAAGKSYQFTGDGYEPKGQVSVGDVAIESKNIPEDLQIALRVAAANATAQVVLDDATHKWRVSGDPTEAALLVAGLKLNMDQSKLGKLIIDTPFDYDKKYRSAIYEKNGETFLSVTGAPERVMDLCHMDAHKKSEAETVLHELSREGLRVVAFAYKLGAAKEETVDLPKLIFGGFYGMQDVLHPEIAQTVEKVRNAGIKVIMITGDHKETAAAIARNAGIFRDGDEVITGDELDRLNERDLTAKLKNVTVFARVTPEDKQKIVQAFRSRGDIVAMTGDGVNDAPSLVAADLGLAMGISGTEVAKEAADIVLLDDNFKSIVAAVEEGRNIYITIKKVIAYLFATSAGEILVITAALALGLPLPITAAQIIWLNLVTDGFLDISLAMEPKGAHLLSRNWKESKSLVDGLMLRRILLFAVVMMLGTLYVVQRYDTVDLVKSSSLAVTVMAAFQWFNAWNARSRTQTVFNKNIFSNRYLILATVTVVSLHIAALHVPFMQQVLTTMPLTLSEWLVIIIVASFGLWAEEVRKLVARARSQKK